MMPMIHRCFNYTLQEGDPPRSWREAVISVIPKEGKDRMECGSYRPISVLNIDYRLYASIMAKRLEHNLPDLIDIYKTGFVKQTQAYDDIWRTLHIIDCPHN